ncbi:hypothetical protein ACFQH2_01885 [Natronoarchaeum sp. GCM10025703]
MDVVYAGEAATDRDARSVRSSGRDGVTIRTTTTVDETLDALKTRLPDVLIVEHELAADGTT